MSNEDRLFAAPVQSCRSEGLRPAASSPVQQQLLLPPPLTRPVVPPVLFSVIGGRMVQQPCGGNFPINGQQLQLQLDQLTSAMTDMMVEDETMEVSP